jgi:hypothetical protein
MLTIEERGAIWDSLCEEFDCARQELLDLNGSVTRQFAAVYRGNYEANPSVAELDKVEAAWRRFDDVSQRMTDFSKKHS